MNAADREFFLMRILSGRLIFKDGIEIRTPSVDLLYTSFEIYKEYYEKAMNEDIIDDTGSFDYLVSLGKWNEEQQKNLDKVLPGHIEWWKEELYKARLNLGRQETIRKGLLVAKKEYERLNNIRHSYDHVTCAGIANYAKLQYLVQQCTYKRKKRYNWTDYSLYVLMLHYQDNIISEDYIREISHNSPWHTIWAIGTKTGGVFGKPSIKLSLDQQRLAMWSMMYDNIRESPNPPSEDVINDDDMLDGWFSLERKNRGETQQSLGSKIDSADEIYIPVAEPDSTLKPPEYYIDAARKIDNMNSSFNKNLKKQRFKAIEKAGGVLTEQNLPDVKQDLLMQMARRK